MQVCKELKEGAVIPFTVLQNTTQYSVRVAHTPKGLWISIQQSSSNWKLTVSEELITQTVAKVSTGKLSMSYKEFTDAVLAGLRKSSQRWSIGIMTPVQLEVLRGGSSSKQLGNTKIYLILSDVQNRLHYPYTLQLSNMDEKQRLQQAIKKMKNQLDQLRGNNDKSQSSFSLLNQSSAQNQQLKLQNEQIKKKIKLYQQSLTQKRGAVQIDMILREKNTLQIKAQTRKRQELKDVTRMKGIFQVLQRETAQVRNQVQLVSRQLALLEDNVANPAKLKSHALRVMKNYQVELRNSKKIVTKQARQIETVKRNINNSKNTQKRLLQKIKQIQTDIEQAQKKANIKQISNRLHSSSKKGSSAASSSKAPSIASQSDKSNTHSYSGPGTRISRNQNLVRQNLLKRTSDMTNDKKQNKLLRTTPNIQTPNPPRKTETRPTARPILSSHHQAPTPPKRNNFMHQKPVSVKSDSGKSNNSSTEKKKQVTAEDRQKQKLAMERLTGANKKKSNEPVVRSNTPKQVSGNRRQETRSLNNKPFAKKQVDSSKDILNRMKEIKAQYNTRYQNNSATAKNLANKVAQLTANK